MRMAQPEDMGSAVPTDGERLALPQADGSCKSLLGVLGIPEPLLRLQRTQNVWQVPELDVQHAQAFLELWPLGSFLVTGHNPSQVLVLKTGPSLGEVHTYQIQKFPGGVSLESSNLCMPDLLHLLAFLSASRDILPRTLVLPSPPLGPRNKHTDSLRAGHVEYDTTNGVMSVVNQLYLETHGGWGTKPTLPETETEIAQKYSLAPRKPAPHRVSWVEGPLNPEVHHLGPEVRHPGPEVHPPGLEIHHPGPETHHVSSALSSLVEEKEEEVDSDHYKDEEEGPEDMLTAHIWALARVRSSYVAKQYRGLQARLTSDSEGPHRPGDPATELLQDVRHLLTDLQDHLAKDPNVRAVFESRGPAVPQKDEDLGWGRGLRDRAPPPALRSRIHARLEHLHAACAPRRKVALLLAVCGDVYAGLAGEENEEPLGADAFLPALTEELIWSPHIGETQLDVEFLMELLDPAELQGEAGYYLTTWFGALYHIAHYQPDAGRAPQGLSSEARDSLRQWHRRRTLHQQDQPRARSELSFEEPWAAGTAGDQ